MKLEYFSPIESKKDRIALEIIREARASGELRPGQTVVELTSGNTGTGLAVVCRALGHPFVTLILRGNPVEQVRQMEAFGAEVIIGAHLAAAWRLLAEQEAGATIAFLACDSGLKYLSTDLFP